MSTNSKTSDVILAYITCPSVEVAKEIGKTLIQEKIAACCNIYPQVISLYEWNSKLEEEQECLLIAKTKMNLFPSLSERVQSLHPYECPCTLALPIINGNKGFLDWLDKQTK